MSYIQFGLLAIKPYLIASKFKWPTHCRLRLSVNDTLPTQCVVQMHRTSIVLEMKAKSDWISNLVTSNEFLNLQGNIILILNVSLLLLVIVCYV